jgi:Tfp pilus assembly protein PilF
MGKTIKIAAAIAVLIPTASYAQTATESDRVDVAFEALAEGRTEDAVVQLQESRRAESDDPAVLINLGTAYARQGRTSDARAMFQAALTSSERYELELADGSWIDSRKAARLALANLDIEGRTAAP